MQYKNKYENGFLPDILFFNLFKKITSEKQSRENPALLFYL
jgi:hypothetical protein